MTFGKNASKRFSPPGGGNFMLAIKRATKRQLSCPRERHHCRQVYAACYVDLLCNLIVLPCVDCVSFRQHEFLPWHEFCCHKELYIHNQILSGMIKLRPRPSEPIYLASKVPNVSRHACQCYKGLLNLTFILNCDVCAICAHFRYLYPRVSLQNKPCG